ncbi:MAG: hypothetical protein UT63_C0005G0009 [Candidatus Gottesmanbacteria bacterium GW2011_GWC2_39_8]|nr:MAG: hypothetical protein UT63_C0005G0009 [Candidatus Gottesmanbacteria bacterium GW2011_GWC2_39_8]
MNFFISHEKRILRFFEIAIPVISWSLITLPLWLSPFHPALVAYFILGFDVYFFYKSFTTAIFSTISYFKLSKLQNKNWFALAKTLPNYKSVYHSVIITNYKESIEKVDKTLSFIVNQDFPLKKLMIILAMEEREGDQAKIRADYLVNKYKNKFLFIGAVFHPVDSNETLGKASNSTYAAKFLTRKIKELDINPEFTTVTSCDADSLLPIKYFSYLTYMFLTDEDRYFHFYWAPVLLYSNFWSVSIPIRIQATLSSITRLAILARPSNLIHVSTYSMSWVMLEKIGYWDTNIIPEDWHIFLQAFFTFGQKVRTIPIYLTISRDAVQGKNILESFISRYEQEKRWAWGVTDAPYALFKLFTTPQIPFLPKFLKVSYVLETHIFWPVSFFILTLGASIPPLVNPVFARTALGHSLPQLSGLILTITTVFLITLIYIDMKSRPARPSSYSIAKTPLLIFQWLLLPAISFFFSSLPALEAHTRLLFGKRLEYKVTKKI